MEEKNRKKMEPVILTSFQFYPFSCFFEFYFVLLNQSEMLLVHLLNMRIKVITNLK